MAPRRHRGMAPRHQFREAYDDVDGSRRRAASPPPRLTLAAPLAILGGMPWQPYHTVWTLVVLGWIANYMVRMALSPLLEPVMAEFHLSHAGAGFLFSVFFYGYLGMQIPAGFLGDRFGRKRVLVLGIVIVAASSLATGLAATLLALGLARLLTGLAQG